MEFKPSVYKVDSSKLKTFMSCPRQCMFEHVFGWKSALKNHNDLAFGTAWHGALEYLALHGYSEHAIGEALKIFMQLYRMEFDAETDDQFKYKNPDRAFKALIAYVVKYADDFQKYKTIYSEVAGKVAIHPDLLPLYFKIDWVVERISDGKIFVIERKTTKNMTDSWKNSWLLSIQTGTYAHVLFSLFDESRVGDLYIDGAAFGVLSRFDFERIPIERTKSHMQVWLWNAIQYMDSYMNELGALENANEDAPVLEAFPMNTENCQKYWGCAFMDFCTTWTNPKKEFGSLPLGFQENWWDPEEEFKDVEKQVEL